MPRRSDIHTILVIGSGPIVIGQAAEFDYAGTQACLALKEEGYEVVLINSNPATIMTDRDIADRVYIEPLTFEFVSQVLRRERPDALIATMGGQTGLNMAMELDRSGILDELGVELLGTGLDAIRTAEDRKAFKELMENIGEPIPASDTVHTVEEAVAVAHTIGYPLIVRPAFTLGGSGGGICDNEESLRTVVANGLTLSPITECLVEQSIAGYKEIEYEMMRDANDDALVVCTMENFDPVGVHTGDSIVFAPTQTLTDREHQMLRDASLKIVRALGIEGGCNVQLALDPNSFNYYVIEVNPRVSRSSALASKATGYPIARIAAKIAVGLTLDEIPNPVTGTTLAMFEPALDYVVAKIPRWPFDKFPDADRNLGTQMKATGEVMSIGRTIEEALLKAVRSLSTKHDFVDDAEARHLSDDELKDRLTTARDDRLYCIVEALRRGMSVDDVHSLTMIDVFFLDKIAHIIEINTCLADHPRDDAWLRTAKRAGFPDSQIALRWNMSEDDVREYRHDAGLIPTYKMVDTCAGEFESSTPYFYSTYETENESERSAKRSIIVLGSGPIRIGQGIEFDYATVHSVKAIQRAGYEAIVVNSNPETVSTDFSISDKLYFEPLTFEDVMNIVELEKPEGVIVQFGGQTAINLAGPLAAHGVPLLGTQVADLDLAEDRGEFGNLLSRLDISQAPGGTAHSAEEAHTVAQSLGYPVLVRPSYVIGGQAMAIIHQSTDLDRYLTMAVQATGDHPLLIDRYLEGNECEVDAICDGTDVLIPGIMEHIERSGVHSGDSMAAYPPQHMTQRAKDRIVEITTKLALALNTRGILNIQFVIHKGEVYVIEANPRASRTVPFLSKITGVSMAQVATRVILGESLRSLGYDAGLYPEPTNRVYVKSPVFSFSKLDLVDSQLGPEMKSTGEVMGADATLDKALYKAFEAAYLHVPDHGRVLITVADEAKAEATDIAAKFERIGFDIVATAGTAAALRSAGLSVEEVGKIGVNNKAMTLPNADKQHVASHAAGHTDEIHGTPNAGAASNSTAGGGARHKSVADVLTHGEVQAVVNVASAANDSYNDGAIIRREAIAHGIPLFTSLDTAAAICQEIEARMFSTQMI